MRCKLKLFLTLPMITADEPSVDKLLKRFGKKGLHEKSTLYDILTQCGKKRKNRLFLQIAFLHALLKASFLIGALWVERSMTEHLRAPGIVVLKTIHQEPPNEPFPFLFPGLATIPNMGIFGQMFATCFSFLNRTLLYENSYYKKTQTYALAIGSLALFWLLGAFGVKIAERVFDAVFGDSMLNYFANSVSEDLTDQAFPRGLRKTTRASRDADIMQMVQAFNNLGPNVANVIKNDLSPLLVKLIILIARQIFLAVYEKNISILFVATVIGLILYRNKDELFEGIVNHSKSYHESVKSLSANSTDVLENINVVKSSATEADEKKFRLQLFQDMILSKKKLDKTVQKMDRALIKYGSAYGISHIIFGPGSRILSKWLQMLMILPQNKESLQPPDPDHFQHLFDGIELVSILFADLSFVTNVIRTIFQKSADMIIHSNEINEQVKIIFNDDEVPAEKKEAKNKLAAGPGEVIFDISEAFGYKSYVEERTQMMAKYAKQIVQQTTAKIKAKMRKEQGLD